MTERAYVMGQSKPGHVARNPNPIPRYTIEGELVTTHDIAARIGKTRAAAAERLKREQGKPGAVTWAGLRGSANG